MNDWGISRRILTLAIMPTVLVTLLLGLFFINNQSETSSSSLRERGKTISSHLALASEYAIITLDNNMLKELVNTAKNNDADILAIAVYDNNNRVLASVSTEYIPALTLEKTFDASDIGTTANLLRHSRISEHDQGLRFHSPIIAQLPQRTDSWHEELKVEPKPLGYVGILMSEEHSLINKYKTMLTTIIISAIGLAFGIYLSRRMSNSVTQPITEMVRGIRRIKEGNLETRVHSEASAELKTLQDGINLMAQNLQHAQEELQTQVHQATSDLQQTLDTLEINNFELDTARKQAEESNRTKTEFLANMGHEIRTPMNGVIGFTDALLKTDLTQKQKDFLFDIKRSATSLLDIIEDILDYSKIEAGKMSFEHTTFDFRECVDNVFKLAGHKANEKGLELVPLVYSDVPTQMWGDPLRITQVMANLVNNAIKFTKSGSIELSAEVEAESNGIITLKVKVKDTGIGISEEQRNKLFKAFNQADTSTKRQFGGTGLGLVISKSLVEKMGGGIGVESDGENGSTFWFTLKCEVSEAPTEKEGNEFFKDKSVLIFEEHDATRIAIGQILELWGIYPRMFSTVEDISTEVELYNQGGKSIDLIILSGQRFLRRQQQLEHLCKQAEVNSGCSVISFTTDYQGSFVESLIEMGVDRTVQKPITHHALRNVLLESFRKEHDISTAKQPEKSKNQADLLEGIYVLAVDDNPANLRLVNTLLEDLNIKVDTADSGIQAVTLSKDKAYDAIFMDIQMPEMDGLEATRTIRANELNQSTPIIALTAHALASEKDLLLASGMNDYMTKPVSEQDLVNMLIKWTLDKPASELAEATDSQDSSDKSIDWILGLKLANGNVELAKDMLKMLVESNHETAQQIHAAFQSQNFAGLLQHVHKLHGASCYVGTPKLKKISSLYETKLKKENYNQLDSLHEQLIEELDIINEQAPIYLDE